MNDKYSINGNVKSIVKTALTSDDHYPLCERKSEATIAASNIGAGVSIQSLKRNLKYFRNRIDFTGGDAYLEGIPDREQLREHIRLVEVARQLLKHFTNQRNSPIVKIIAELPEKQSQNVLDLINQKKDILQGVCRKMATARKKLDRDGNVDVEKLLKEVAAQLVKIQDLIDKSLQELDQLENLNKALWKDLVINIGEDPLCASA